MTLLIVVLIISAISIGTSIPVALSNHIPISQVFYDFSSCLVFIGVSCELLLLLFRFIFKHKFNPNSKLFYVSKAEVRFYEKTKIRFWKKIIPDLGFLVGFKKQLTKVEVHNSQFYKRFLFENVNAAYLHFFTFLISPTFFVFLTKTFYLSIGIPCMLISFLLNLLPALLQRYLRPRLLALYNLTCKREQASQNLQPQAAIA